MSLSVTKATGWEEAKKTEAKKKNAEAVNKIINILSDEDYTVQEAYSILDFAKRRIKYTSKVGKGSNLISPLNE